jgi:Ser/Thr protein kinase RdoA (MazF antagonist)
VLDLMGIGPRQVVPLSDVPLGNANWLVKTAAGQRHVLRRYHLRATTEDLAYEHAVLDHLAAPGGWCRRPSASRCSGGIAGTA